MLNIHAGFNMSVSHMSVKSKSSSWFHSSSASWKRMLLKWDLPSAIGLHSGLLFYIHPCSIPKQRALAGWYSWWFHQTTSYSRERWRRRRRGWRGTLRSGEGMPHAGSGIRQLEEGRRQTTTNNWRDTQRRQHPTFKFFYSIMSHSWINSTSTQIQ